MSTPFPFVSGSVLQAQQLNDITNLPINNQTASYVAVAGDAGKRIVMNVATANTVTINDSVFAVGDTIFISTKDAATTVTAGAGVTINTAGSLVIAQHGGGTLVATSASVFTFFSGAGNPYGVATGGTPSSITVGGEAYTLLTFTSSGTLTVTKSGIFDVAVIGGGAGGGKRADLQISGSGAGAGGLAITTLFFSTNASLIVGAQGTGATSFNGNPGNKSSVQFASGELFVGAGGFGAGNPGGSGASGGGGGGVSAAGSALNGSQGNAGGAGKANIERGSAGGGGFSAAGAASINGNTTGTAGGAGFDISAFIGGSTFFVCAGGGGSGTSSGAAGSVGAGAGGVNTVAGGNATNFGCGGGGSENANGGDGEDGVVLVRFKS